MVSDTCLVAGLKPDTRSDPLRSGGNNEQPLRDERSHTHTHTAHFQPLTPN